MKRKFLTGLKIILGIYISICTLLYFYQENIIFFPQKLESDYEFRFDGEFQELNIKGSEDELINGLLFHANNPKGLIFYLHGNAGSLKGWGKVAKTYTDLNYDVFILDYKGFGKSEGEISSQEQLFEDNQLVYQELIKKYSEDKVIILGYSIGTGMAAKLASVNKPKALILQAPYYSLTDMMRQKFSWVPTFILKYKFNTSEYLKKCDMPIVLFHGDKDRVIYYGSSLKLQAEFTKKDLLITLEGQGHNGMTNNTEYKNEIKNLLREFSIKH